MKILQLRFKNLNSLAGEWSIDFTAPEYVTDGIFVISGATGAGKSTIMDAICLALYGETPRLNEITGSSNEIMSRHTGECFSEVVFETQKGKFRCTWSQHRARKKANGDLQPPKHEIVDALTEKILESKKSEVENAIIKCTGMDFKRFTQSMLLAQGGFAAFLQAKPDDRAAILQQLTGTEIYSKISILVNNRRSTENKNLELLNAEIAGIDILNQEEENLINQELEEKQNIEKEVTIKKTEIDSSIQWLMDINKIKEDLASLSTDLLAHKQALTEFESDRLKLDKATRASEIEGEYVSLTSNRKLQLDELSLLNESKAKIPELNSSLELAQEKHRLAVTYLDKIQKAASIEQELITRIREMDVLIREKQARLNRDLPEHKVMLFGKILKIQEKKKLQSNISTIQENLVNIDAYLVENKNNEKLVSELTGIKAELKNLQGSKDHFLRIQADLITTDQQLKTKSQECIQMERIKEGLLSNHKGILHKQSANREALNILLGNRPLTEYRNDLTNLMKELAYLRKIASLEEERTRLIDNQPCPLCGSMHHPFAEEAVPIPNETEAKIKEIGSLIEQAEKLDHEYVELTAQERKAADEYTAANQKFQQELHEKETLAIVANQKSTDVLHANENYSDLLNCVVKMIEPYGISEVKETSPETIHFLLDKKLLEWQKHQQQRTVLGDQIRQVSNEIDGLNDHIKITGTSLRAKMNGIIALRTERTLLSENRIRLYGEKNPDEEEIRINNQKSDAEKYERETGDQKTRLGLELIGFKNRISELEESTSSRKPLLYQESEAFNNSLHRYGFENEANFIGCRLPKEIRDNLLKQASTLDTKQTELITRKKDREERLVIEEAKKLTLLQIDELRDQQQSTNNLLSTIREEIVTKRNKLADNAAARTRAGQKMLLIEQQKKECQKWDALHDLIGSFDGKKYRNFAQGLTFEIMISHANRQLMKLTDRYLLIRDQNQPLDLNVIDNYQAGEERTTKNLSGGESFIVSLALALGLSKMASKNVRVDSLFLDEGFGSLDEDALEIALETLSGLRQDGKLIGVISHVPALKERISTKIMVEKMSGGKSRITGPGCSQIS